MAYQPVLTTHVNEPNSFTLDFYLKRQRGYEGLRKALAMTIDKPALVVYAKFEDGKKEERVTFGQSGSDVYFSRPGEPDAAKADSEKFNDAIKAHDELSK